MTVEFKGISAGQGNPYWGGGSNVFIISLGKILETKNI
jgi:hypothetical protein